MRYLGGGIGHLGQESSHTHWRPSDDTESSTETQPLEPEFQGEPMMDSGEELGDLDFDDLDDADSPQESDGEF